MVGLFYQLTCDTLKMISSCKYFVCSSSETWMSVLIWKLASETLHYNRVPIRTLKPGKPGDLNFIYPDPEMDWNLSQKVRKLGQNKAFSIKPGMLRYTKFQYHIETMFSIFCTCANLEQLWCLPFGAKIVHIITWRMTFLTWTKPGDNMGFYDLNKLGTLL